MDIDRRGFFAAVLAPLVVPWKPKPKPVRWIHWPRSWGKSRYAHRIKWLQRTINRHYNEMVDNIYLSR